MARLLIVATLLASGCTPVIYEVPGVRAADISEVSNCRQIGRVTGIPGVFGPLKDIGLKDARKRALEKAAQVGGNTVVFDQRPVGEDSFDVPGTVYSC